ncbi:enoyl-CoA hydratase [Carnobacterium divergens]|uniref:MaoC/PaaZ C-terminal domain-containing protein n=1 Tax=Carnobacterium divergens TaxID=2748 RepID=UPI001072CD14|nr:MaoC/PaaZ C-terminal domain-containing protein [Carnobacterium divergens]TFJ40377.1 enoyl-CoA hydratase [Carnobacterium divergens]TFJ48998.1 enoyl-CoA hydratase [Carnobacterium divergens]TFJ54262.1 enoyl-CoA hydratase [Carnobacterium divergens]TFJ59788.1 enoyl-CoA hydratase [Carnobacterium divergens]TFJ70432.1 enoyl-CoA hydratase [Carnobacterium divergens]
MMKPRKMGKLITEIQEGDQLSVTESIEDKDILLYLGLTNDANPLFIQHDYTNQTEYEKPLVPVIMLIGIMTSTISKHLPGPGSNVVNVSVNCVNPVYHYETITFEFEVIRVDLMKEVVTISVEAKNMEGERVIDASFIVEPPRLIPQIEEVLH